MKPAPQAIELVPTRTFRSVSLGDWRAAGGKGGSGGGGEDGGAARRHAELAALEEVSDVGKEFRFKTFWR